MAVWAQLNLQVTWTVQWNTTLMLHRGGMENRSPNLSNERVCYAPEHVGVITTEEPAAATAPFVNSKAEVKGYGCMLSGTQ